MNDKEYTKFNQTAIAEVIRSADQKFLLDLNVAICEYYNRVAEEIANADDMTYGAALARTLQRVHTCHQMINDMPQMRGEERPDPAL